MTQEDLNELLSKHPSPEAAIQYNERITGLQDALELAGETVWAKHVPYTGKIVPDGWQLVPIEPTIEMIQAATHNSVGFGTRAAYKAMLAAAPKLGGK